MPRAFSLATGVSALLLAVAIPFLRDLSSTATPVVILFFIGLMGLQQAARLRHARTALRSTLAESVLLALAALAQLIAALALPAYAGLLAYASAALAALAVALHLCEPAPATKRGRTHRASPRRTNPAASTTPAHGRETGTVKWFNTSKGFGFISRDTGEDIFVHFRAIRGEGHRVLAEGQRVEFSVTHREKGLQAEDVVALA